MGIPTTKSSHIGRKIERIRELKGVKQESLATSIGVTQQTISKIEQSATIEDEKLKRIADALGVTIEAIKDFDENALFNNINSNHTFNDNSSLNNNFNCAFNPIDKWAEAIEENKKLYERLLEERAKVIELQNGVIELYKAQQKISGAG